MQSELLEQGIELMLYGMGTVFVFLALLVISTSLMSALIQRLVPAEITSPSAKGESAEPLPDNTLVAVISAAIHQHRSRRK